MTAPRRRWSFSLRTLFVVLTATSMLLGVVIWQVNIVNERKAAWASVCDQENLTAMADYKGPVWWYSRKQLGFAELPFWRKWLGDEEGICQISIPYRHDDPRSRRINYLFPEADIIGIGQPADSSAFAVDKPVGQ